LKATLLAARDELGRFAGGARLWARTGGVRSLARPGGGENS
jgi:hypothetical protein